MNPTIGNCKQYLPPREKRGGLPFNHQAATDALLSQIWHQINCHVTCLTFNKGGCSLQLRNKQVFKPQLWCIRGADKSVFWYSDQEALEPLSVWGRGVHCSTARDFLGQETLTSWCTRYSHKKPKHSLTGAALWKQGQSFWDLQGTQLFFSPALLPCSST